jgi:acetoin utilization protein AcuB
MLVRDRMSRSVIAVGAGDGIERAQRLMREHAMRHLPVLHHTQLIGILSDRDLRGNGAAKSVREVMTVRPIAIAPDASVDEAACVMQAHKISALPVVEKRRVVGMLTTTDVLQAFVDWSGVAEPTTRIVVTCGGDGGAERRIRQIVLACHAELKWLHRQGGSLHLRLKTRRVDDVATALEAAGFPVTAVVASREAAPRTGGRRKSV